MGAWRSAFLLAPYLRDTFVACGVLSETFETAITWDRFEDFHATTMEAVRRKVAAVCEAPAEGPGAPRVSCRFTHVYPDGPAPYFTVMAPAVRGGEVEQWDEIKAAAAEAVIEGGGTITHHHAVGRDHRPWYDRQRPPPFAAALSAAKNELDPAGNPQPWRPDRPLTLLRSSLSPSVRRKPNARPRIALQGAYMRLTVAIRAASRIGTVRITRQEVQRCSSHCRAARGPSPRRG